VVRRALQHAIAVRKYRKINKVGIFVVATAAAAAPDATQFVTHKVDNSRYHLLEDLFLLGYRAPCPRRATPVSRRAGAPPRGGGAGYHPFAPRTGWRDLLDKQ
jgi:hypothetical protein